MKTRINVEFIINAVISAILTIAGGASSIFGIGTLIQVIGKIIDETNIFDLSEGFNFLLAIFVIPYLIFVGYILIIGIYVCGFIPLCVGLVIGSAASIARFTCTENGEFVTPAYRTLMTVAYIVMGAFFTSYAIVIVGLALITG